MQRGLFNFHPKCKGLNLNHLCYADDLLIFAAADLQSIGFIKHGMDRFKEVSGLPAGLEKSSIFFCNTKRRTRDHILSMTQFRQGVLPVKYLGLPLITSRLKKRDCTPIIEKILARVNSWVTKSLSYAGRLQLIKSTLASMQVFWCSTFLLPAAVIKDCERIWRSFLWGNSGSSRKHSLVKWSNVCLPRQEGGLGIKSLKAWNQALLLKQIWSLLNDHSLWVQWCKLNLIRKHSFWTLPSSGSLSWSWRQILLLRNTALTHLVYVCGKGARFSLWYDPWFHGTSIYAIYGHKVIYDAGLANTELVHSVIENDQWCWPTTSPDLLDIQSRVQDIPITSSPYCIMWEIVGRPFLTKQAWKSIRTSAPQVVWAKLVWHPSCIPKHAFCLWLAIQGALKTLDKLLHRVILTSASCVFNCGDNENVDHLYFACPFA
ncbi:zf-RVT domain-containing protein [Cephalotus follicularis]|uniref:Zf-RVT domain-containing protein n=1 Tax=Cephalotus follicularis TaxID=3775 RepID=A0A1Q3DI00_CEPFO|nr:zf-RVT domain-containing protein [Cephalotus follicularis]